MSDVMAPRSGQMGEAEFENALLEKVEGFYDDPVGYVYWAFPWGEGDLAEFDGPDTWQLDQLMRVGQKFRDDPETTIRECTASGHGIG